VLSASCCGAKNKNRGLVGGEWARLVRIGWTKSKFYFYGLSSDGKITHGFSVPLSNHKLRDMVIKEPLRLIDIPEELRPIKS